MSISEFSKCALTLACGVGLGSLLGSANHHYVTEKSEMAAFKREIRLYCNKTLDTTHTRMTDFNGSKLGKIEVEARGYKSRFIPESLLK